MKKENIFYVGLGVAAIAAVYLINKKSKQQPVGAQQPANTQNTQNKTAVTAPNQGNNIPNSIADIKKGLFAMPIPIKTTKTVDELYGLEKLSNSEILEFLKSNQCSLNFKTKMSLSIKYAAYKNEALRRGLSLPQLTCEDINAQTYQTSSATMNTYTDNVSGSNYKSVVDMNKDVASMY